MLVFNLLTSIASLAEEHKLTDISHLVEKVAAQDCLVLVFSGQKPYRFLKVELSANNGETKYLYHKDPSGKPGLFLSWTIPSGSVVSFQKLSKEDPKEEKGKQELQDFWEKKFSWLGKMDGEKLVTKNKLLNDARLLEMLNKDSRSFLFGVLHSYAQSFQQVKKAVESKLLEYQFLKGKGMNNNKLLVTIAFEKNGKIKYPSDIPPFVSLFSKAVSGEIPDSGNFVCTVCNSSSAGELRSPYPIEFMTQDQLVYLPDGNSSKKANALALCQTCSDKLRMGQAFINSYLSSRPRKFS